VPKDEHRVQGLLEVSRFAPLGGCFDPSRLPNLKVMGLGRLRNSLKGDQWARTSLRGSGRHNSRVLWSHGRSQLRPRGRGKQSTWPRPAALATSPTYSPS